MTSDRLELLGLGLLLLFFMFPAVADKPEINKDMPLQSGELVWRISNLHGSQTVSIRESESNHLKLNYDISDCNFCEGQEDNCENDGVFTLDALEQGANGKLGIVCHVGAHSQRLMIFVPELNPDSPVFEMTGLYFIDYEFMDGGLVIRYDALSDTYRQPPKIKTVHWSAIGLQCPQNYTAKDVARTLIEAELSGIRLLELKGSVCLSQSSFPYLLIDQDRTYNEGLSVSHVVESFDDVRIVDVLEIDSELDAYKVLFEVKSRDIRTGEVSNRKDSIQYFLYQDKKNQSIYGCGGVTENPAKVQIMKKCLGQ